MNPYIITCGSTVDLSKSELESLDIPYICFRYELDGKEYIDDLGQTLSYEDFYTKLQNGSTTKTTQINSTEFCDFFEPFFQQGYDILHIIISSGLTGVINSAILAKNELQEKYPDRKIEIVDSLAASCGYGILVEELCKQQKEGKSLEELCQWIESNRLNMHHWFFSNDLSFYIKGGRISKTAGYIGNVLGICPLLNMDVNGKLKLRDKIRGQKRIIKTIVAQMIEHVQNGLDYSGPCYVSHSLSLPEAHSVAQLVEDTFPNLKGKVKINPIGTTIGCHSGPGTVALFFWGDKRVD